MTLKMQITVEGDSSPVYPSPETGQAGNPRSGCSHKGRLGGVCLFTMLAMLQN